VGHRLDVARDPRGVLFLDPPNGSLSELITQAIFQYSSGSVRPVRFQLRFGSTGSCSSKFWFRPIQIPEIKCFGNEKDNLRLLEPKPSGVFL